MEPKAAKSAPKGDQKKKKERCSEKVGSRTLPAFGFMLLWSSFGGNGAPKGAFLEIPKIENGTKIQFVSKERSAPGPSKKGPRERF
jgi:hypothetical protein